MNILPAQYLARAANSWFSVARLIVIALVLFPGSLVAQDYRDIDRWVDQYCNAARPLFDVSRTLKEQRQEWELSYALMQGYQQAGRNFEQSSNLLKQVSVPKGQQGVGGWARSFRSSWTAYYKEVESAADLQRTTIEALWNMRQLTNQAVRDIENASNRQLFITAMNGVNQGLEQETRKIYAAMEPLSPPIQARIHSCTIDLQPSRRERSR
jgi:hypothetical protein